MNIRKLKEALFWSNVILSVSAEDYDMRSYALGKDVFRGNLYKYQANTEPTERKANIKEATNYLSSFFKETPFDEINKTIWSGALSIMFSAFNVLQTWKAIEYQVNKKEGAQHTYSDFFAKPFMEKRQLSVLDLKNKKHYYAKQDLILCYESLVYSSSLEKYYSFIEHQYSNLKYSPKDRLSIHQRFMITLFLGSLIQRTPERAILNYSTIEGKNQDYDANLALSTGYHVFNGILLNRWLFVESEEPVFPFQLRFLDIGNKRSTEIEDAEDSSFSFTLKPNLKLFIPPTNRQFMDKDLDKVVGQQLYGSWLSRKPLGTVVYLGPNGRPTEEISQILVSKDIKIAESSTSGLLVLPYELNPDSINNPYFDFSKFLKENNEQNPLKPPYKKFGGIPNPSGFRRIK